MTEVIMKTIIGLLLFICGIQDLKHKKFKAWIIWAGAILVIMCIPFLPNYLLWSRAGGFLVGVGVILISKATRGKIGSGDGMLLCISGVGLGLWVNLELFAIALFLAAVFSIALLIIKKVNRNYSIPFIPFLFISYIGVLWIGL